MVLKFMCPALITKLKSFLGIALRKVEEKKEAAAAQQKSGEKTTDGKGNNQTDVASILARRVAVEMSDSDNEHGAGAGGQSDSEYDSDDWGDESTA